MATVIAGVKFNPKFRLETIKLFPLNGSPVHYHYVLHTGEPLLVQDRQRRAARSASGSAAIAAGRKAGDKNTAVSGLQCHHV